MSEIKKVIVGMSGGVDSAVSALLLLEQGYEVEGLFMKNWEEDDDADADYCAAAEDLSDAQQVSDKLGIKLHSVNFASEYWDRVFENFLSEYSAGRTPNPDILCNKEIKFKAFLDYALNLGADAIATGHYCRNDQHDGMTRLLKGVDNNKDQSYFLYAISQQAVARTLFPVGELEKPKVRELADKAGFLNHRKKDSTGICFIGERRFTEFLQRYLPAQPGEIQTLDGEVIGQHTGLMYYTLGQRKGLGIGGRADASEDPWFVSGKDLDNNVLKVCQGGNHPALFSQSLITHDLHWIGHVPNLDQPLHCRAKTRYRQPDQDCVITRTDAGWHVAFKEPQRAVTPGQSLVLYDDEVCLGGGIIESTEPAYP